MPQAREVFSRGRDGTLSVDSSAAGGIIAKMRLERDAQDAQEEDEERGHEELEELREVRKDVSKDILQQEAEAKLPMLQEAEGSDTAQDGVRRPSDAINLDDNSDSNPVANRLRRLEVRLNSLQREQQQNQKDLQVDLRSLAASLKNVSDKLKYGRR